jgi:hypothetical protein
MTDQSEPLTILAMRLTVLNEISFLQIFDEAIHELDTRKA